MCGADGVECAVWARGERGEARGDGADAGDGGGEFVCGAGELGASFRGGRGGTGRGDFVGLDGDWLIRGMQFAKAAGARVIATTSSDDKAALLKKLGADHIINYKSDPEWGASAKKLTANEAGVDHIIEVGGPRSMAQSLAAVKIEGVINIIGFLGGVKGMEQPSFLECLFHICVVRGILVGSRELFEEMNRAIDVNGIKPVVDEKVFGLAEAKDAFQYLVSGLVPFRDGSECADCDFSWIRSMLERW